MAVPENKVFEVTTDRAEFTNLFREYLEGLPRPIDSLLRTDIFANIPMKHEGKQNQAWGGSRKRLATMIPI